MASFGLALLAILFFLRLGAGWIAPPAENHALGKRLCGLAALCVGIAIAVTLDSTPWANAIWIATGFGFCVVALDALTERPVVHPEMCRSLVRRGLGAFSYLLTPGWPTGGLFFTVGFLVWITFAPTSYRDRDAWDQVSLFCFGISFAFVPTLFNDFNRFNHRLWLLAHLMQMGVLSTVAAYGTLILEGYVAPLFGCLGALAALGLGFRSALHFRAIRQANWLASEHIRQESARPLPTIPQSL